MTENRSQAEAGFKLQALTQHIKAMLPHQIHHSIDVWMEDVQLHLVPEDKGQGFDIGQIEYTAQFSFERFPFKQVDPATVMAGVMAWLMDNDESRSDYELEDPSFDVEPESEDTVIMTMEIEFLESLMVVEDESGPILWQGQRFKLAPYEIWVAEYASVNGSDMDE